MEWVQKEWANIPTSLIENPETRLLSFLTQWHVRMKKIYSPKLIANDFDLL